MFKPEPENRKEPGFGFSFSVFHDFRSVFRVDTALSPHVDRTIPVAFVNRRSV